METIISIIKEITEYCNKHDYFHAATLFVKTHHYNKHVTLIAVESPGNITETLQTKDINYTVYKLRSTDCYSRILNADITFAQIFNNSICLKDELNIAPVILSSIKPILKHKTYLPEANVLSYVNYDKNRKKELSIKFNNIAGINEFINNIYIPLSYSIKESLSKAGLIFQFYRQREIRNISITFFFKDNLPVDFLIKIQKYLYIHSSEQKLQYIEIPYHRPYSLLDDMEESVHREVLKSLDSLTSYIITHSSEPITENEEVTTLIYLYLITAKIIFKNYNDFLKCNNGIYEYYLERGCSDTLQYIINNHVYTNSNSKTEKEFHHLSKTNIQALYLNYQTLIENWNIIEENIEFQEYLSQVYNISSKLNEDRIPFFQTYTNLVFSCYDISTYYKAYIPYVIKYLNNEI